MGSVSILAALVRFITLKIVQSAPRTVITHTIDVWALVEIVSSILAVCTPSLRTFWRRHELPTMGRGNRTSAASAVSSEGKMMSGSGSRSGSADVRILTPAPLAEDKGERIVVEGMWFHDVEARG